MSKRCIFLALSLILISCGNKNSIPIGILKPDKMRGVLWDIIRADAVTTQQLRTNISIIATEENVKLQKQIFAIHEITKEDFYKSFDYYRSHPSLMKVLLDSVVNKANRERITVIKTDSNLVK